MATKKEKKVWYKILGPNDEACHGGKGTWHVPQNGKPGDWMPKLPKAKLCETGYHLVNSAHIKSWMGGGGRKVYLAEPRGRGDHSSNKSCFQQARLLKLIGTVPVSYSYKDPTTLLADLADPSKWQKRVADEQAKAAVEDAKRAKREAIAKVRRDKERAIRHKLMDKHQAKRRADLKKAREKYQAWLKPHRAVLRAAGTLHMLPVVRLWWRQTKQKVKLDPRYTFGGVGQFQREIRNG